MNSHEDYVTYEQAIKIKELGFNWECDFIYYFTYHNHNKPIFQRYETTRDYEMEKYWDAPTLAQAHKWLREVHKIEVCVCMDFDGAYPKGTWGFTIRKFNAEFGDDIDGTGFSTYEHALSKGIDDAIELLKEDNNDKEK